MSAARKYTSAIDRLRQLPAIFVGTDLTLRFGWSPAAASVYLSQWRKSQLVRSLGGHSDVHMNLVVQPQPNPEEALRLVRPRALMIGANVLREAGWTTQIVSAPEVVVPAGTPMFTLDDFVLTSRPKAWFDLVEPGIVRASHRLSRLAPAWCLADMVHRARDRRVKGAWLLAPDDIDLDVAREAPDMPAAMGAFGLDVAVLQDDRYGALYDELQDRLFGAEGRGEPEPPAPRLRG